jgi:uncharacterized protein (DUF1800 family)
MALSTAYALARFGLGPREGTLAQAGSDPRGFLEAELGRRDVAVGRSFALPDSRAAYEAHDGFAQEKKASQRAAPPEGMAMSRSATMSAMPTIPAQLLQAEISARLSHLIEGEATQAGFVERLVWFWMNHFAISVSKSGRLTVLAGPYEREAIRPHVLGRFADMLVAVETHPAMLLYLDNAVSIGPNSPAGRNRRRGLNENLAREILELHTLGVNGGYTQSDVTRLSALITGWTVAGANGRSDQPGTFSFNVNWHEPGPQQVLGATYQGGDETGGIEALRTIARHPSTARHIAVKLARHFVSDVPPPALVERLTKVFRDTDGDLYQLSLALLRSPEAWATARTKLRTPREFVVAAMRLPGGFSHDRRPNAFMSYLTTLGEPLWTPPAPNGFPDDFESWASPEGLGKRLDVSARLSARVQVHFEDTVATAFGAAKPSEETVRTLRGAESSQQAATLLLMSPEFQRR